MSKNDSFKIRPSARIIKTIGEDLIKNPYTSIIELVKNAYDADSKCVKIKFSLVTKNNIDYFQIVIKDYGHGMDLDTIENRWMVPATIDKLERKLSPNGRQLQGRKGIGRYTIAILGGEMYLTTIDESGNATNIFIDWNRFDNNSFLEDIDIKYKTKKTKFNSGTKIKILQKIEVDENSNLLNWTKKDVENLLKELRKLKTPTIKEDDEFKILLEYKNLEKFGIDSLNSYEIEPFPLIDLYDYRVSGEVKKNQTGDIEAKISFENQNDTDLNEEIKFNIDIKNSEYCGELKVDLRVYDREPEAITELIKRGFKDPLSGDYVGKREAKKILDDFYGVGVYRGNFRIRPYGDSNNDWLELNHRRVNNPTQYISTNQIIGFIHIEQEEKSNLHEQSSREGLKDNDSYNGLIKIVKSILTKLENNRYSFRINTKRGRKPAKNINEEINNLFNFDTISNEVTSTLKNYKVNDKTIQKIEKILKESEKEKSKELQSIKDTIVMYESYATIGKLIEIVIHESRKPLATLRDNIEYLKDDIETFFKTQKDKTKNDIFELLNINDEEFERLNNLLKRIEPLTTTKQKKKVNLNLYEFINKIITIRKKQFEIENIKIEFSCDRDIIFLARENDFYIIFTNLFENSIYWLKKSKYDEKIIKIMVEDDEGEININFIDNGDGVEEKFINNIFEPGFSMKSEGGSGIGLSLVAQAMNRNMGKISYKNNSGACFKLKFKKKDINE